MKNLFKMQMIYKLTLPDELGGKLLHILVFSFRCHASSDMALFFVLLQQNLHLFVQLSVSLPQHNRHIFVNGAFADTKLLCRLAHRALGADHIPRDPLGALSDVVVHIKALSVFTVYAYIRNDRPLFVKCFLCYTGDIRSQYRTKRRKST